MRSNVRLRSNVFPSNRPDWLFQVRGRPALRALLQWKAPGMGEAEAAALLRLRPRQVAELAWQIPCSQCDAMPEGSVSHLGSEAIEFRCPLGRCEDTSPRGALVNLDLELVNWGLSKFGCDISGLVQKALADLPPVEVAGPADDPARLRQFAVRLTRTQHYLYGRLGIPKLCQIVNASLRRVLER